MNKYKIYIYQNDKIYSTNEFEGESTGRVLVSVMRLLDRNLIARSEPGDEVKVNDSTRSILGNDLGLHTTIHGTVENFEGRKYERHSFDVIITKI